MVLLVKIIIVFSSCSHSGWPFSNWSYCIQFSCVSSFSNSTLSNAWPFQRKKKKKGLLAKRYDLVEAYFLANKNGLNSSF